ncbi:MAG TPA: hypothetical protein VIW29_12015 [Polyangiaceae bacterium]
MPPAQALSKLDLLLMIDNSRNMLEKQRLLLDALDTLLGQLTGSMAMQDIHVGAITSSLGSHGSSDVRDVCTKVSDDDHAQLLGQLRPGLTTWNSSGFLKWDPAQSATPPGASTLLALTEELTTLVNAAGDQGCGYEASFEAWYRFLVDPEPPLTVARPETSGPAAPQGIDETLLAQRRSFLRPDSVLSIVVLSDENDCSIVDSGFGWLVTRSTAMSNMYRATSECATDPNSACCRSCGAGGPTKAGCSDVALDPLCSVDKYLTAETDSLNLRCWDQKRRFGLDLLYPISRYVDALTRQTVPNRAGQAVPNPLFARAGSMRHPSQVVLTGIVGVPWQDLADEASLTGTGLTLLGPAELTSAGRWSVMLGDASATPPVLPKDPFMLETPLDRSTLGLPDHPLVPGARPVAATSTDPEATLNGHEFVNPLNRYLQYACSFRRAEPLTCDQAARDAGRSCDCYEADLAMNSPACQPPGGGPAVSTQYFDVAAPGLRHLELMRALGDAAVPASACPKVLDQASPDYGYRPAMRALAARLATALDP